MITAMQRKPKPTPTQQRFLDALGKRYLFAWGGPSPDHISVSRKDGEYRHGHYDADREQALKQTGANRMTIKALVDAGLLEQVYRVARDG